MGVDGEKMIHENKWPIELFSSAEKEGVKKGLEEKKSNIFQKRHYFLRSLTNLGKGSPYPTQSSDLTLHSSTRH